MRTRKWQWAKHEQAAAAAVGSLQSSWCWSLASIFVVVWWWSALWMQSLAATISSNNILPLADERHTHENDDSLTLSLEQNGSKPKVNSLDHAQNSHSLYVWVFVFVRWQRNKRKAEHDDRLSPSADRQPGWTSSRLKGVIRSLKLNDQQANVLCVWQNNQHREQQKLYVNELQWARVSVICSPRGHCVPMHLCWRACCQDSN